MNEIVVGVNLSQSARAAMTWAAVRARVMGQTLQAVHAGGGSPAPSTTLRMSGVPVRIAASEIDAVYREAVAAVFDSIQPEPDWRRKFFAGEAGPGLVAKCRVVAVPAAADHNADKDHDHAATTPRRIAERDHELASWPAVPMVSMVDACYKALRRSRSRELALASVRITSGGRR